MDASILSRIRQSFTDVPDQDERAKIGPRPFLIALIVAMVNDTSRRSIAGLFVGNLFHHLKRRLLEAHFGKDSRVKDSQIF